MSILLGQLISPYFKTRIVSEAKNIVCQETKFNPLFCMCIKPFMDETDLGGSVAISQLLFQIPPLLHIMACFFIAKHCLRSMFKFRQKQKVNFQNKHIFLIWKVVATSQFAKFVLY